MPLFSHFSASHTRVPARLHKTFTETTATFTAATFTIRGVIPPW